VIPGSRLQEIENILPVMIETYLQLKEKYPHVSVTLSRCGHIPQQVYKNIIGNEAVDLFDGPLEDLFDQSDLALVTSGTATLQTALMGVPMIILYKTSRITYLMFKTFITGVNHIGLPNIIAGEEIVPELIQDDMTSPKLVGLLQNYVESPAVYQSVVAKLVSLRQSLGSKKPSIEVTKIIKNLCGINEKVS
jgi:lipid-A-disaccharide synthase